MHPSAVLRSMGDAEESCRQAVFGGSGSDRSGNDGSNGVENDDDDDSGSGDKSRRSSSAAANNNNSNSNDDSFSDASALEAMTGIVNEDGVTLLAARAVAAEAELQGR